MYNLQESSQICFSIQWYSLHLLLLLFISLYICLCQSVCVYLSFIDMSQYHVFGQILIQLRELILPYTILVVLFHFMMTKFTMSMHILGRFYTQSYYVPWHLFIFLHKKQYKFTYTWCMKDTVHVVIWCICWFLQFSFISLISEKM